MFSDDLKKKTQFKTENFHVFKKKRFRPICGIYWRFSSINTLYFFEKKTIQLALLYDKNTLKLEPKKTTEVIYSSNVTLKHCVLTT